MRAFFGGAIGLVLLYLVWMASVAGAFVLAQAIGWANEGETSDNAMYLMLGVCAVTTFFFVKFLLSFKSGLLRIAGEVDLFLCVFIFAMVAFGFGVGGAFTIWEADRLPLLGENPEEWVKGLLAIFTFLLGMGTAGSMITSLFRYRKKVGLRELRPGFLDETLPAWAVQMTPFSGHLRELSTGAHLAVYEDGLMLLTKTGFKEMQPNRYGTITEAMIYFKDIVAIDVFTSDEDALNAAAKKNAMGQAAFNATIGEVLGVRQSSNPIAARLIFTVAGDQPGLWVFAIPAKLESEDIDALKLHVKAKLAKMGESSNPLGEFASEGIDLMADAAGLPLSPGDVGDALSFLTSPSFKTDAATAVAEMVKLRIYAIMAEQGKAGG